MGLDHITYAKIPFVSGEKREKGFKKKKEEKEGKKGATIALIQLGDK